MQLRRNRESKLRFLRRCSLTGDQITDSNAATIGRNYLGASYFQPQSSNLISLEASSNNE